MPEGIHRRFRPAADWLCDIEVKEAEYGDVVAPGRALIAPGHRT
jgi:two-component system chemotaxis response regulator CheB